MVASTQGAEWEGLQKEDGDLSLLGCSSLPTLHLSASYSLAQWKMDRDVCLMPSCFL